MRRDRRAHSRAANKSGPESVVWSQGTMLRRLAGMGTVGEGGLPALTVHEVMGGLVGAILLYRTVHDRISNAVRGGPWNERHPSLLCKGKLRYRDYFEMLIDAPYYNRANVYVVDLHRPSPGMVLNPKRRAQMARFTWTEKGTRTVLVLFSRSTYSRCLSCAVCFSY